MEDDMFSGMHYVYQVYKEKSFSKAAQKLFISQPALSATIKRVEEKVGHPLFDRSTKPLMLTECGEKYMEAAEQIMNIQQAFTDYVNEWQKGVVGNLTIGGTSLFTSLILPPLMAQFSKKHPNIQFTIVEDTTGNLEEKLQRGEIDLMMDNDELSPHLAQGQLFFEEYILVAVPKHWKINDRLSDFQLSLDDIQNPGRATRMISLDVFKEEPFVLQKIENDTRKRAIKLFQEADMHPTVLLEVDQQMTAYMITASGMGISFIGNLLISSLPDHHSVVFYKVNTQLAKRSIYLYSKKGRYMNPAMQEFLAGVEQGKQVAMKHARKGNGRDHVQEEQGHKR